MKIKLLIAGFLMLFLIPVANAGSYPLPVTQVLAKAGTNRPELEKVIAYYRKTGDALKIKAAYFLIGNMDIHFSADYYWADKNNKRIAYSELDFPNYDAAQAALRLITLKNPGIHPVTTITPDISVIKAGYLIGNINTAFKEWKTSKWKNIAFNDFCEYILPYRVSVEPLQDWRLKYQQKYLFLNSGQGEGDPHQLLNELAVNSKAWFASTYGATERREPLPRLGPLQILFRRKGLCQDMANLQVFALRSRGMPVSLNIIPYWATSTGSHFINTVFDPQMKPIQYDAARPNALINKMLTSEPSKVLRTTYAKQNGVLANLVSQQDIPEGFMRTQNYIDITDQYWNTTPVHCHLFPDKGNPAIVYSCIFNGMKWRAAWWGRVSNGEVTFSKMSKGVVYLPACYGGGKLKPAGYPVAIGYHHEQVLMPDLHQRKSIVIKQEVNYLAFQPGKKYKLFFWNRGWAALAEQVAGPATTQMMFRNVPANALLLLVPEYSKKKERPFIITDDGQRNWF